MKKAMTVIFATSLLTLSTLVHAAGCDETTKTIVGSEAAELAYVLKNSSFATKSVNKNGEVDSIASLRCVSINRGVYENALPQYSCDNEKIGPMIAKLTFDTLSSIGIYPDYGMSKAHLDAKNIKCTISNTGIDNTESSPSCTVTAIWANDCQP